MTELASSAAAALRVIQARGGDSVADLSPEDARKQYLASYAQDQLPFEPVDSVKDTWCGNMRLRIWRGRGASERTAPAMVYLHGGGWVIGAIETHEEICRRIANRAKAVVISPEYRLAPEAPFPTGLKDCESALRHVHSQCGALGIEPSRIAVGGDSAGGNLAAALALLARDGTVPEIAAQVLFYPNTDQQQGSDSFRSYAEGYGLTAREMAWFRNHYLETVAQRQDVRAAPVSASKLSGVASAVVVLAGHDILYSEGARYAARLQAESRATVRVWPGQIHGFISMSALIPEAEEAVDWACEQWMSLA